jgi:hypothetical protein
MYKAWCRRIANVPQFPGALPRAVTQRVTSALSLTDESGRRRRDKSAFQLDAMELTPKRHKRNNQVAQNR